MSPEIPSILDQALHYAREFGWAVFPLHSIGNGACTCGKSCSSPGKHPIASLVPHGVLDATKDENQIRAWFGALGMPNANIGIATGTISGLIVVDVDLDKGAEMADLSIAGSVDEFLTVTVKTGGGRHFYYKLPDGEIIKNSQSKLGNFIDVRGEGGYVVAPPSVHLSGKIYEFVDETDRLLDFPDEWIQRLNAPVQSASAQNGNGSNGNGIHIPPPIDNLNPDVVVQGNRNGTFASLAGKMRHYGFGQNAIEAALLAENERICQPPMDDREVRDIARKIAQNYQPSHDLTDPSIVPPDSDIDAEEDYENTLKPYLFGEFLEIEFEEKEILGFHIGKRDIAIIQAATNAGKTTLLRNVGLCMAAGREFLPFFEGGRPVKIAYFDFESDAQDVQRDLKIMFDIFNDSERENIKKNLIVIPKGLMGGELFQFNTHEKWANNLIQQNAVEFIFVDNVSAAYDLNDENSNAEVTKKVIKPLLKMAYTNNAAFLFAHHYGKGKQSEIEAAGVHAGRGASALQSLSRTVINMFGDVSKGEPLTVECAKRKVDGGQNYREVFKLDPDRWFHHTTIVPPPPRRTAYQTLREFMESIVYPNRVSTADVIESFESEFEANSIKKALSELYKDGFIEKPKHGFYCGKDLKKRALDTEDGD